MSTPVTIGGRTPASWRCLVGELALLERQTLTGVLSMMARVCDGPAEPGFSWTVPIRRVIGSSVGSHCGDLAQEEPYLLVRSGRERSAGVAIIIRHVAHCEGRYRQASVVGVQLGFRQE